MLSQHLLIWRCSLSALTDLAVLAQQPDEAELIEAEQRDELALGAAVVGRLLQNAQHLLRLALRHHRVVVVLAQVALQPVGVDVERVQPALALVVVAAHQLITHKHTHKLLRHKSEHIKLLIIFCGDFQMLQQQLALLNINS